MWLKKVHKIANHSRIIVCINATFFPDDYSCKVGEKFACKRHDKIQRCIDKQYLCDYRNDCWNTELGSDEYSCCKYCGQ